MNTNNNKKTTLEILAIICLLILVGCTVIGLGIGISISKIWSSTLIGIGLSFIINAGLLLKIYYKKNEEESVNIE